MRVVLGAGVLLALAWRLGLLASLRGRWRWLAVFAVVEITIPFPLIAAGEQHVASSLAAILIAAAPLFVALLALRFDASERVTGSRLVGLLVGLAGVVALVGIDVAGRGDELLGAAAILVAALCYAIGPMVLKRHLADLDPRASMGAALAVAALVLTPAAALDPPDGRAAGGGHRRPGRPRPALHRGGVRHLRGARRRRRGGARPGDHLHRPRGRGRLRRRGARRAPGSGRDRRAGADPARVVAGDTGRPGGPGDARYRGFGRSMS